MRRFSVSKNLVASGTTIGGRSGGVEPFQGLAVEYLGSGISYRREKDRGTQTSVSR
jgi:hypothetical protein